MRPQEEIPDKYLIDQMLDSPQIRRELADVQSAQDIQRVFRHHGIFFEIHDRQQTVHYVQTVLHSSEAENNPDTYLHL